jgi:hypothetical protein
MYMRLIGFEDPRKQWQNITRPGGLCPEASPISLARVSSVEENQELASAVQAFRTLLICLRPGVYSENSIHDQFFQHSSHGPYRSPFIRAYGYEKELVGAKT